MASSWQYRVTLVDKDEERSTVTFDLGLITDADFGDEALAAQAQAQAIHDQLVDVTDAYVKAERVTWEMSDDNQLPAGSTENVSTVALVPCHLNAPGDAQKIWNMRIPAASSSIFLADGHTVDPLDADLVAYVEAISDNAFVSDDEVIDTSSGPNSNGIGNGGYKYSLKRKIDGA